MNKALLLFVFCFLSLHTIAQTATNFSVNDCDGNPHDLFAELDGGKVVVLVWVMPCGSCDDAAAAAYDIVQDFATTNPGKVLYYLIDDYGNSSCSVVTNWANSYVGTGITIFQNLDNVISMLDYGSNGMPKVVVVGGYSHNVYFNKNNTAANDPIGIETAINSALDDILSVNQLPLQHAEWNWDASDKTGSLKFKATRPGQLQYSVYNLLGQSVNGQNEVSISSGEQNIEMNFQDLTAGAYFLQVRINEQTSTYRITIH